MADLEFDGTPEQRQAQGEAFMKRISGDFYGNGRPGLMSIAYDFMTAFRATENERHRENSEKLNAIMSQTTKRSLVWTIAGVLVSLAAVLVGILSIVIMVKAG